MLLNNCPGLDKDGLGIIVADVVMVVAVDDDGSRKMSSNKIMLSIWLVNDVIVGNDDGGVDSNVCC